MEDRLPDLEAKKQHTIGELQKIKDDHAATWESLKKKMAELKTRRSSPRSQLLKNIKLQMTFKRLWNRQFPNTLARASTCARSKLAIFIPSLKFRTSKSTPSWLKRRKRRRAIRIIALSLRR